MQNLQDRYQKILLPVSLILMAIGVRLVMFPVMTSDMQGAYLPWYNTILELGRWKALGSNFYSYTPSYIYLLDIMTLFSRIPPVSAIKLISVLFDFSAALAVYKIIQLRFSNNLYPWLGFFGALFLPVVVIDGSYWGQCDSIYTSFLLWSLFFILKNKYFPAILFFSVALTFKLQALLFIPVFLVLFLHKKIPFYWFLAIPLVYCLSSLPAWLAGRPFFDMQGIYFTQINAFNSLSMNAPNLYIFINFIGEQFYIPIVLAGLFITAIFSLGYLGFRWKKWTSLDPTALCYDAVIFTTLLPFLLPKMHDRYFFTGSLFLLVLVFYDWDTIIPAVLIQVSSLFAFLPYLTGGTTYFVAIGALINLAMILLLYKALARYKQYPNEAPQPNFLDNLNQAAIAMGDKGAKRS